jgi:hypothetical protein
MVLLFSKAGLVTLSVTPFPDSWLGPTDTEKMAVNSTTPTKKKKRLTLLPPVQFSAL